MLRPIEIHHHAAEPIMVADPECRWLTLRRHRCRRQRPTAVPRLPVLGMAAAGPPLRLPGVPIAPFLRLALLRLALGKLS